MKIEKMKDKDGLEVTVMETARGHVGYAVKVGRRGIFEVRDATVKPSTLAQTSFEGVVAARHDTRAAAEADIVDIIESSREAQSLPRRHVDHENKRTPSGVADSAESYGEGVVFYGTPGHGHFKLDAKTNAKVFKGLREPGGWYEEDEKWAIVTTAAPELFTARERRQAMRTMKDSWPDEVSDMTGVQVTPAESRTLRKRAFQAETLDKYVVISAIGKDEGVECTASLGGKYGTDDTKTFVVPSEEYKVGEFGFVIDESRHVEIRFASPSM